MVELFSEWDETAAGKVGCGDFIKAVRALVGPSGLAIGEAAAVLAASTNDDLSGAHAALAREQPCEQHADDDPPIGDTALVTYARLPELLLRLPPPGYPPGCPSSPSLEGGRSLQLTREETAAERRARRLSLGPTQPDRGRGAKMTAKNLNANYVGAIVSALPPMARLESPTEGGASVQEQLRKILVEHRVKLIDLFREWDDDGNGALDKKELRRAIAALGYACPRKEADALFDQIDADRSGWIEYDELKRALKPM